MERHGAFEYLICKRPQGIMTFLRIQSILKAMKISVLNNKLITFLQFTLKTHTKCEKNILLAILNFYKEKKLSNKKRTKKSAQISNS